MTCGGSIIVEMTRIMAPRRLRKRNLANAYATGMDEQTVNSVPRPAYSSELRHQVRRPGVLNASA